MTVTWDKVMGKSLKDFLVEQCELELYKAEEIYVKSIEGFVSKVNSGDFEFWHRQFPQVYADSMRHAVSNIDMGNFCIEQAKKYLKWLKEL